MSDDQALREALAKICEGRWLTINEVAGAIGAHRQTVTRWLADGGMPVGRVPGRLDEALTRMPLGYRDRAGSELPRGRIEINPGDVSAILTKLGRATPAADILDALAGDSG